MKNKFINLKKFYDDNGYCIIKNLISNKKIDLFLDNFKKKIIFNKKKTILPSMNLQKINSLKKKNNILLDTIGDIHCIKYLNKEYTELNDASLKIICSKEINQILKILHNFNKFNLIMSMFFDGKSGTPAHQDSYYLDSYPSGNLTAAWIACENINTKAGKFFLIPKSNKIEITLNKEEITNPNKYEKKIHKFIKNENLNIVAPPLKKGDVLFWNSNTIHGSMKNVDKNFSRKSFTCHFIPQKFKFVRNKYNPEIRKFKYFNFNDNFKCRITNSINKEFDRTKYISRSKKSFDLLALNN